MIEILSDNNDDEDFIKVVEQILKVGVNLIQPCEVFFIKIDHWFDFKWLNFSHKSLGAVRVSDENLRVPPFVPDRVIEEIYFYKEGDEYKRKTAESLHIYQASEDNTHRKVSLVSNSAIFLWFSGGTINNTQGSLMTYVVSKESQVAWYISFMKKTTWKINKTKNISKGEVKSILEDDYLALIK